MGSSMSSRPRPGVNAGLDRGSATASAAGFGNSFASDRPSFLQEDDLSALKKRIADLELENTSLKGGK